MYRGHTVGVVIPAYNEEGFVGETLEAVPSYVDRVYAVDDGSSDDTWAEITEAAERLEAESEPESDGPRRFSRRVVPIQHGENRGVGGAIKTGYLRAREEGIDVTTVMGGDGQMEPEMLDRLLDPIVEGRADYTKGNRFLNRTDREDMPAFRFVGNAILSGLTKIASGYWATGDPQSGYTAISHEALERADVEGMYEFYGYCNDLLVKLNVADLRVLDVPRPVTYGDEESHIRYSTYIPRVSGMLLRNFLWRLRTKYLLFDFHPVAIAYAVGAIATLAGLLSTLVGVARGGPGSDEAAGAGTADRAGGVGTGVLVGLGGVGSLLWAMTLDMKANEPLNGVDRRVEPGTGERRGRDGRVDPDDSGTHEDSEALHDSGAHDGHPRRNGRRVRDGTKRGEYADGAAGNGSRPPVDRPDAK